MAVHTLRKGLDLPITGEPAERIEPGRPVTRVALMAADYVGMRPTMFVEPGSEVKRGQPLFEDKKNPGVIYTALGAGTLTAVNRGARRALQSVVIELSGNERAGAPADDEFHPFESYSGAPLEQLSEKEIRSLLIESGLWTCLRTRPFGKVPPPDGEPHSIFVTAMDTNPLAPPPETVLEGKGQDFETGLQVLRKLTTGPVYLCKSPKATIPGASMEGITVEEFTGPHPAGLPGTHIHFVDPVPFQKIVWYINYQEVVTVGRLFQTGRVDVERVISLAGPQVISPRLLTTRAGAHLDPLVEGELQEGENRVISGSVLSGRTAMGDVFGYLGQRHNQVSVLREGRERKFLGWLGLGRDIFSVTNAFASALFPNARFDFTTNTHGDPRAMVPIGTYEWVTPLDIIPTYLLRALTIGDLEEAEKLGCLELEEEDLALCSFACPGKYDFGHHLRNVLTEIEREG
ncbi:MAG: Na(+)-translocating NADH-quinone reductase subunit A [Candidatus Hydrogenedentota bacterium]